MSNSSKLSGIRLHLDTDFAGDTDDAAALVMLLGWPDADLVGITTTADPDGMRAAYVRHVLRLADRAEIPVASGAGWSVTGSSLGELPDHRRYWGDVAIAPAPSPDGADLELLAAGIEHGATVVAIGPSTNLARLESSRPGILRDVPVVLMGGWVRPPADGLPQWGPDMDWNVQSDTTAALAVFGACDHLTLVTLPATLGACLRQRDEDRLGRSGPIGRLLARQATAHGADHHMQELGRRHRGLPDDVLNFHYDPVACAVALGWPHVTSRPMAVEPRFDGDVLRFEPAATGKLVDVVLDVDGPAFADAWLDAVERADARA